MLGALLRKAYRDLTRRRVRSVLTLIGILIGVGGVVAIISTAQNLAWAQAATYADASQADISYWLSNAPASLPRALAQIENVRASEVRTYMSTRCEWTRHGSPAARDVALRGVTNLGAMQVERVYLRQGRLPRQGEALLEHSAAGTLGLGLGDRLKCRGDNGVPDSEFTIVGTAQTPNYPNAELLDYALIYTSSSEVTRLLGATGGNALVVTLKDVTRAEETAKEISQLLDRRNIQRSGATIRDPENFLGKRELDALLAVLAIFSAVGMLTSGFLVANTLAAIVTEQTGEIGALKALGATREQVLGIYLLVALVYGVVGTVLGLIVGVLASRYLMDYVSELLNLTAAYQLSASALFVGIVMGIGVTLVAGTIPALAATRISVKRALEAYGISPTYGAGRLDRALQRLVALPPLAAMSVRNLARRTGRAAVTMMVIGVAVATSLAAQAVSVSVNTAIDDLFRTYRADAWVWFGEFVGDNMTAALMTAPGVERAEVWSLQNVWVANQSAETARARLWGLPADTTLYEPNLISGRWIRADETDAVVISTDLVESLGVGVGDTVRLDKGESPREFRVVGTAQDNSVFLGSEVAGKVFVSEETVAKLENREGWGSFFALGLTQHDAEQVDVTLDGVQEKFKRYSMGSDSAAREVKGAKEQTRILTLALAAMTVLIGLIGALGVVNTITLNVLERRREIGVLRAIGASDGNVVQAFLTEGLLFGLGGWVIGMLLGYPLGWVLVSVMERVLFHLNYIVTPQMMLTSLLLALVVAGAASLAPAFAAARMRVQEVLRYE